MAAGQGREGAAAMIRVPVVVGPTDVGVGSEGGLRRLRMIANAMRPGVIRVQRDIPGIPLDRNEQPIIVGVAFGCDSRDIAIELSNPWVCYVQTPSSIVIGRCRTRCILDPAKSALSESQKNSWIQLLESPHVRGFRSEVVCRDQPLVADLSLETEIPLPGFHVAEVIVHGSDDRKIRPRRIPRDAFARSEER